MDEINESVSEKFSILDNINNTLEDTIVLINTSFEELNELIEVGESRLQEKVDKICIDLSNKINEKLSRHRELMVDVLHRQYVASMDTISLLEPLVNLNPTDLGGCVKAINLIIKIYASPYQQAIEFVTQIAPKLQDIAINCALLASMPAILLAKLHVPNINFDKLNINFPPPSMSEITTGFPEGTEQNPEQPKQKRQYSFNSYDELLQYPVSNIKEKDKAVVVYKLSNFTLETVNFNYSSDDNYYLFENVLNNNVKTEETYFDTYEYKSKTWEIVEGEFESINEVIEKINSGKGADLERVFGYGASKPLLYTLGGYTYHIKNYSIYTNRKNNKYVIDNCEVVKYSHTETEFNPPIMVDVS